MPTQANQLLEDTLVEMFKDDNNPDSRTHFTQGSVNGQRGMYTVMSKVLQRHQKEEGRLPCWSATE